MVLEMDIEVSDIHIIPDEILLTIIDNLDWATFFSIGIISKHFHMMIFYHYYGRSSMKRQR